MKGLQYKSEILYKLRQMSLLTLFEIQGKLLLAPTALNVGGPRSRRSIDVFSGATVFVKLYSLESFAFCFLP